MKIETEGLIIRVDYINLYEKYRFCVFDKKMTPWGDEETVYTQAL